MLESPRVRKPLLPPPLPPPLTPPPPSELAPPPCKPPRRKSAEKELQPPRGNSTTVTDPLPQLQVQIVNLDGQTMVAGSSNSVEYQRRTATLPRPATATRRISNSDKIRVSRQTSAESRGGSVTSRSRSFASSRESLHLFGISQNFSSEVMRELYGSKTSLLQHLDNREQRRNKRLSDPAVGGGIVVAIVDGDNGSASAATTATVASDPAVSVREGRNRLTFSQAFLMVWETSETC